MSRREKVEEVLGKARELEKNYDWVKAAALHEKASSMAGKRDFLRKGEIQEKIGFCFHRAAMQAGGQEEFKERMRRAVEAYEKAHGFYEKLMGEQKEARIFRCKAVAKYLGYWLTSVPSEKRRLLDECLELEGKALASFSKFGDMLEYGRTYSELSLVFFCRGYLEWDMQTLKSIGERGLKWGEKAVAALSELGNSYEIARANLTLATCLSMREPFVKPEYLKQLHLRLVKCLSKAVDLSEKVGDRYLLGLSHLWWGGNTGGKEAVSHFKKTLECGKRTRDNFLIAWGLDFLAHFTYWKAKTTEDPEQRRKLAKKAMKLYDKAEHHSSIISFMSPRGGVIAPPGGYAEYYWNMALWETDPQKKLEFLERSVKAGMEALKLAEDSDIPDAVRHVLHVVSKILESRAHIEPDPTKKRSLLEKALKHREKSIDAWACLPTAYWGQAVMQNYLAGIEAKLAELEPDFDNKRRLLEEAVSSKEKCLKLIAKKIPYLERIGDFRRFASIQKYQDSHSTLLVTLYNLTNNPEHLRKAIEILQKAIESASKLDLVSRMAESYWKIAKARDILGEHLEAAESFERASKSYMKAARKIPQLKGFYSEYASYMEAWAELEKSRYEHENENYALSREHHRMCSRHLKRTEKWSYLSPYFSAWSLLEHGEELSRLDKLQDAKKAFDDAGRAFGTSVNSLRRKVGKLENSEEKDEASKLVTIARLRKQYCMGRVSMEEAKLSNRKGDRISSANKYASAARIFTRIVPNLEREEARVELQFAATLCQAWEKMELAEERGDTILYKKAAELFAKAGETSRRKTAGLIAIGNSCFCEALEQGMRFMVTSNMDFYAGAKLRMENAAGYYRRAGFENPALWVEATKKLFDAYVYAGEAEAEAEPEKRVRFYLMAEKCLELSAKLFGKAGYLDKKNKALENLERIRKERELALSLSEVLIAPTVLSSTTGVSMPDSTEKAAGLNEFKSVNIRTRLSVPKEFIPGEKFQVKLDLINVGKKPGLLVRVEGLAPRKCKVLRVPSHCVLEDDSLNLRGRRLNPLSVESISIWVQVMDMVGVSLSPRVVYVDELGNFRTIRVEGAKILPVVEFKSEVAQVVFKYLVDVFVEDSVKRKLGVEKSGWRSLPQIIKGAMVSRRSLYGTGGRLGPGLSELQRKGLVDVKVFHGERGRGGHILRVRIHYEKELVGRYVKAKAPDVSM